MKNINEGFSKEESKEIYDKFLAIVNSRRDNLVKTYGRSARPEQIAYSTAVNQVKKKAQEKLKNQAANTTIASGATITWQFGAQYALPGEQVFSFIANPGNTERLDLDALKELTSTAIGGRGTFPNGPDVLAINVYKVAGTATPTNVILRWGEAQA